MFCSFIERTERLVHFEAFNGDTLENFRQCTIVDRGRVFYQKARQPLFKFPVLYVDRYMYQPINMAIDKAFELGQTPLVMELLLYKLSQEVRKFMGEQHLKLSIFSKYPVVRVWIPKGIDNWRAINRWNHAFDAYRMNQQQRQDIFHPIDPLRILSKS